MHAYRISRETTANACALAWPNTMLALRCHVFGTDLVIMKITRPMSAQHAPLTLTLDRAPFRCTAGCSHASEAVLPSQVATCPIVMPSEMGGCSMLLLAL